MIAPACLACSYALDLLAGDPEWLPHPVRAFGWLIRAGERLLATFRLSRAGELAAGAALSLSVTGIAWMAGRIPARLPRPIGAAAEILLAWTALATRCLLDEVSAVLAALESGDLPLARVRLARIVGRDTMDLGENEIARALVETLAESACDGIVAPLFWLAVGGVPAALAYKAVNTLDSMIGHPEPPYRDFGCFAARLDDAANLLPARLTTLLVVGGAALQGGDARAAWHIWRRDGDLHASPNAGQSEAAMAGALGVRLGGLNFYDGLPHAGPVLGAEGWPPGPGDVRAASRVVAAVSALAFAGALLFAAWRRRG
jgi:adenosylcobinamide-phosphate synthase